MKAKFYLHGNLTEHYNIRLKSAEFLHRILSHLQGKDLLVEVSVLSKSRSLNQNRYLHGVIIPCIQRFHYETQGEKLSMEECKAFIYTKILGARLQSREMFGKEVFVIETKHFSEMDTVEFNDAVALIQGYFNPIGLVIPDPSGKNLSIDFII